MNSSFEFCFCVQRRVVGTTQCVFGRFLVVEFRFRQCRNLLIIMMAPLYVSVLAKMVAVYLGNNIFFLYKFIDFKNMFV